LDYVCAFLNGLCHHPHGGSSQIIATVHDN
jgi:hypothetical protein